MWRKTCLAVALCAALTLYTNSSAKALLVDGSYTIELTGALIDPSPGTFNVVGGAIQNFTMDLLADGAPANAFSTYANFPNFTNVATGTMFEGNVENVILSDEIQFASVGTWACITSFCATSFNDLLNGAGGSYSISQTSVSEIPLPAALWLFLTALGGLGLFGWRQKQSAAA